MKKYIKKATLCVDNERVLVDDHNRDCYNAWNEGNEADNWLIPIATLEETYTEVEEEKPLTMGRTRQEKVFKIIKRLLKVLVPDIKQLIIDIKIIIGGVW